ncbi:hypothetical protein HI914_07099 [Erysiphe necator]|nr:hypothetical protein HI914_07099 [Erysiphe necator]
MAMPAVVEVLVSPFKIANFTSSGRIKSQTASYLNPMASVFFKILLDLNTYLISIYHEGNPIQFINLVELLI